MQGWAIVETGAPLQEISAPTPEPKGGEVLLEVTHCGVCHSDLYLQDGYYDLGGGKKLLLSDRGVVLPLVPGHETVGRVIQIGPEATGVSIGDQCVVYPWIGCGDCRRCREGNEQLCLKPATVGIFRHGGFGSHVLVPRAEHLVKLDGVDPAVAATYACSGITAYSAIKKIMPLALDEPIAIIGAGGLGLAAVKILRALKYENIIVADVDENKRRLALSAGATVSVGSKDVDLTAAIIGAANGPIMAVIDFVNSTATANASINALAKGGIFVPIGLFGGDLTIALPMIPLKGLQIRGSYTGSLHELRELIALAKTGALEALPVELVPRAQANDAIDRVRRGAVQGRLVLEAPRF
ncbi:alcohol dehydrogenase [Dongia sp.]|uniref:alcohol dehydrogenase n=1 Tax=Dongia sp. TaxID=1977262 RepID=UPI0035B0723F